MPQNPIRTLSRTATQSAFNLSANTVVKAGVGTLAVVSVTTAGSAAGEVHDAATVAAAAAGNLIGSVPNTVGIYVFNWPCTNGIVFKPGSGQVASISFV